MNQLTSNIWTLTVDLLQVLVQVQTTHCGKADVMLLTVSSLACKKRVQVLTKKSDTNDGQRQF